MKNKYIVDGQELSEEVLVNSYRIALLMEEVTRKTVRDYFKDKWTPSCELLVNSQYESMRNFILNPNLNDFQNIIDHGNTIELIVGMTKEDKEDLYLKGMDAFADLSKEDQKRVMELTQEILNS